MNVAECYMRLCNETKECMLLRKRCKYEKCPFTEDDLWGIFWNLRKQLQSEIRQVLMQHSVGEDGLRALGLIS